MLEREPRRRRFLLDERGFDEVPRKYRKFYQRWLSEGDRIYCMACRTRMRVVRGAGGRLEAAVEY